MEEEAELPQSKAVCAPGHSTSEDQNGPACSPVLPVHLTMNGPELGQLVQHSSFTFSVHCFLSALN